MHFSQKNSEIFRGIAQALPVVLAYVPIGFSFGISAAHASISEFHTLLMSLIVYAGSVQMIAVGLLSVGESAFGLALMALIVNARHFLLSTALVPHLASWPRFYQFFFGLELTDEAFALHSTAFPLHGAVVKQAFSTNLTCHVAWILGTYLGHFTGSTVPDLSRFGFDFGLPAMFIALLVIQIHSRLLLLVAILSGGLGLLFRFFDWGGTTTLLATLIAATFGFGVEQWLNKPSRSR